MSLAVHEPASVLTLRLFGIEQGLQCLGRHLREMKLTVDPGSKSTFNMVRDRTSEMVLQTIILRGVSLFLLGSLATTSFELPLTTQLTFGLSSNTGKAYSTIGLPAGILPVGTELCRGNAFPAVNVSGFFLLIDPLIFLIKRCKSR